MSKTPISESPPGILYLLWRALLAPFIVILSVFLVLWFILDFGIQRIERLSYDQMCAQYHCLELRDIEDKRRPPEYPWEKSP